MCEKAKTFVPIILQCFLIDLGEIWGTVEICWSYECNFYFILSDQYFKIESCTYLISANLLT